MNKRVQAEYRPVPNNMKLRNFILSDKSQTQKNAYRLDSMHKEFKIRQN